MRIALLTGAFKNAGDYLITKRSEALLKYRYPNANIVRYPRNQNLNLYLSEINQCDVIVFAGGPGWVTHMYPNKFPLVENLDNIKPPMFVLGMGCKTRDEKATNIIFSNESKKLIDRFIGDGFRLGCRDELTYQILNNSGITNVVMTGCPAWYDTDYVHQLEFSLTPDLNHIERIIISDPGDILNLRMAANLVSYCRKKYNPTDLIFAFHRGWTHDEFTSDLDSKKQIRLHEWLVDHNVRVIDLSYSADGFKIYDQCNLHIGFRVHAHIYCLSHRIPSFLIEEDGRGFGVNETLGLTHIKPKKSCRAFQSIQKRAGLVSTSFSKVNHVTDRVFKMLDCAINGELKSNWQKHRNAFKKMEDTFDVMCSQIDEIAGSLN